jgi:hydroxymethylpyrimidine/phosphomethylpyrimidine kinase
MEAPVYTALTIAGSDSGGGAGIQADLKAFQANGVFGMSAITAITAQNTREVRAALTLPSALVRAQIDAVFDDLPVGAVKTGMLASRELIATVAAALSARGPVPLVVDPVMVSKSGFPLIDDGAVDALRDALLPLATLVTPNAHEAARLLGRPIRDLADAREAAAELCALGCRAALVKGGHLHGDDAIDVLFDGAAWHELSAPRLDTPHTHGTGCTLAAAIAANLAKGLPLVTSVDRAKRYLHGAIAAALPLGGGHGPTHHFWFLDGTGLFPADDR